ncbi:hypothetical protein NA78x_000858 [Anatilimnocola sp. NA78]|uniref:hypothetical protein n=1 Tax=Anatilimnocola sp. NA78 TaxID=3415683 RepID=UPI003CE59CBE
MNANQVPARDTTIVRHIAWKEVFPWLILLRVFRVAIAPGPLMLATGALAISSLGWWCCGALLTNREFHEFPPAQAPFNIPDAAASYLPAGASDVLLPVQSLALPARQLFRDQITFRHVVFYLLGFLISTVVWTFVGGVITRLALVELGTEQSYDWVDAVRYVARRYVQYLMAPLAPLLAIFGLGLLLVPLGWLMNLGVGVLIAGVLWILVIALGLVAAWLIVGLLFGWPLMIAAVGAKRDGDALQAFSEAFSYVYGKPLHYFFYAIIALGLGGLALAAVHLFADVAVQFGFWATSWGAGADDIRKLREHLNAIELRQPIGETTAFSTGAWLISLVLALVKVIVQAAAYSYFFAAAAAIFLLMRKAVDDKEMDEVHMEDEDVHLETARRAMLSDEAATAGSPEAASTVLPPKDEDVAE